MFKNNKKIFTHLGTLWDYVPLVLLAFLFIAEDEVKGKVAGHTCRAFFIIIVVLVLYFLIDVVKMRKISALIIAGLLWIVLVYIKRCMVG